MGLTRMLCRCTNTTKDVDLVRDGFQMIRVDAVAHAAKVIEH